LSGKGELEVFADDKQTLRFEGTMRSGRAEGPGKVEAAVKDDTERYGGGFTNGFFEGYGAYELSDGSRYEGGFRNDKPDGFGVYKGTNGNIYQGEIKDGQPQGKGFRVWPNGEQYEGAFVKGKQQGTGTLLFPNGDVNEGQFGDDKANGAGKFTAATKGQMNLNRRITRLFGKVDPNFQNYQIVCCSIRIKKLYAIR
jgi:hypothetical protein